MARGVSLSKLRMLVFKGGERTAAIPVSLGICISVFTDYRTQTCSTSLEVESAKGKQL
jgi:hypothetical protein